MPFTAYGSRLMLRKMSSYKAKHQIGCAIRIKDRVALACFMREWHFHNPLQEPQLDYAGKVAKIKIIDFYHGGDVLYELVDVPGIWHAALWLLLN